MGRTVTKFFAQVAQPLFSCDYFEVVQILEVKFLDGVNLLAFLMSDERENKNECLGYLMIPFLLVGYCQCAREIGAGIEGSAASLIR